MHTKDVGIRGREWMHGSEKTYNGVTKSDEQENVFILQEANQKDYT